MLTFLHPEILPHIKELPFGLIPIFFNNGETPALVVKVTKETILAAKINSGFKIYLAPVNINEKKSIAVISAFFDDADEPLTVTTPLFDDEVSRDVLSIITTKSIRVHFFDELSREQLVYDAEIHTNEMTMSQINDIAFTDSSLNSAKDSLLQAAEWFGLRGVQDDQNSIDVKLTNSIYGEGFFYTDIRPDANSYHGSQGFTSAILERGENPGQYQEQDIVQCLLSVFPSNEIYLNPLRTYDREEMCDILIITESKAIIIQAKDSPNKKEISQQNIGRKKKGILKQLKKALAQVNGAISYYGRENNTLSFYINDDLHSIDTSKLTLYSLVIVKELFNDMYDEYSKLLLGLVCEREVPCIALDYPELYQYCIYTKSEDMFFNAYNRVFNFALNNHVYPRLRFGLTE